MTNENAQDSNALLPTLVPALDRRGFLLTSLKFSTAAGAMTILPACEGGGEEEEPDGSFERPWTKDKPAEGANGEVEVPVVYAGLVDATNVRLWVEVLDANTNVFHDQNQTHFVEQIHIEDEFGNQIDSGGYLYDSGARLIAQTIIPDEVTTINVYQKCNLHGWWRARFAVDKLKVPPVGDVRRPLTAAQPGAFPDKIEVHVPVFGKRPDGKYSVEIGDRAAGKLHEMTPAHYISTVLIFDEYHQLRAGTYMTAQYNPEPVYDFDAIGGTGYLRVIALCNLHQWWEAVYTIQGT